MTAGRGRPAVFDDTMQAAYLAHVAIGTKLGDAATLVGINRRTVNLLAGRDPAFRRQLDTAKAQGKEARRERILHGNASTYRNHNCRCTPCTKADTDARLGRRERTQNPGGQVVPLPEPATPASPFVLAQAS